MYSSDSVICFNVRGFCNYCSKYKMYFDEFDLDQKKMDLERKLFLNQNLNLRTLDVIMLFTES